MIHHRGCLYRLASLEFANPLDFWDWVEKEYLRGDSPFMVEYDPESSYAVMAFPDDLVVHGMKPYAKPLKAALVWNKGGMEGSSVASVEKAKRDFAEAVAEYREYGVVGDW